MRRVVMLGFMVIVVVSSMCSNGDLLADHADSLKSLRKMKLAAAQEWLAALTAKESAGKYFDPAEVLRASSALKDAQTDIATSQAKRVRAIESHRDRMQSLCDKLDRLFQAGRQGGELERRAEAQVQLIDAKIALSLLAKDATAAEETGKIEGRVIVKGAPLAEGKITFTSADGQFFGSSIKEGAFKIRLAPAGEWKVAVEGKDVPEKYASANSSGLMVSVRPGQNVFDFDLRGGND